MPLDQDLAAFLQSPVMIILGSSDQHLQPEVGRAVGARVDAAASRVELIVSAWQWPATVANVRGNGRLAATFARPSDYVSYQLKGLATVHPASPAHLARSAEYLTAITATLGGQGLDAAIVAPWLVTRDLLVLALAVEAVFLQTPGPTAGLALAHPA